MSDTEDQRKFQRVGVNRSFESIDEFVSEYVTNISRSGVFIRSKTPLAVGTEVDLRFSVLDEDFHLIKGIGKVVRVTENGMGVAFTELDEESQAYVNTLTTDTNIPQQDFTEDETDEEPPQSES